MCGRYGFIPKKDVFERFGLEAIELAADNNIRPGTIQPVIIGHKIEMLRWGLVPFWAKDPKIGYKMFNARAEDIEKKPSFREPFKKYRCLVPANGFYEWDKNKKPHFFRLKDEEYMAMAGLFDTTDTYTIITTEPNKIVGKVHHRMPVVLDRESEAKWLAHGGKELLMPNVSVVESDSGSNGEI